jgi:type I restriction enzyme, S subunit
VNAPDRFADLRVNPDWAKLPLFDRKRWRRMRFGDFADSINDRVDPADAADQCYVGLNDLDSGDLHIRRWGKGRDVIGTKLCFRKGDIIFGRRRAYQRKLAVAEFDGICSAHAMVVRAKPVLVLPEFLPFLMMSDRFMKRAVEISVGSLSPTINWTTLKLEEFDLPPLEQQRRLSSVLMHLDDVLQRDLAASASCSDWMRSVLDAHLADRQIPRVTFGKVIHSIVAGKSVLGANEAAKEDQLAVLKVSAVGPNGFDPMENKRLLRPSEFLSRFAVQADDFLITRCNTTALVGRVCIVPKAHPTLMLCDKTIKLDLLRDVAEPAYFHAVLKTQQLRTQIEARATGTGGAMKNISQDDIRSLLVPFPPLADQRRMVGLLQQGDSGEKAVEANAERSIALRQAIMSALAF